MLLPWVRLEGFPSISVSLAVVFMYVLVELGYISICVQSGCCYVANIMLGSEIREVSLSGGVGGVNI